MAVVQTIVVDMSTRGANPVAYTHQNDEWRTFHFEMYNNGEAVDMTGWSCKVGAILPSNDGGYRVIAGNQMDIASINGNTVSATLGPPYTSKAGNGVLTLIFTTDTGHTIRPINIDFRIQESADGPDVIARASDFPATLEEIVDDWLVENGADNLAAWFDDAITAEDLETYINAWLDDHPEATTTVQDGAITDAKLSAALNYKVSNHPYINVATMVNGTLTNSNIESAILAALEISEYIYIPSGDYEFNVEITSDCSMLLDDDCFISSAKALPCIYAHDCSFNLVGGNVYSGENNSSRTPIGSGTRHGVIFFERCHDSSVVGLQSSHSKHNGVVWIYQTDNFTMERCSFNNMLRCGLFIGGHSHNVTVKNCRFEDSKPLEGQDYCYFVYTGLTSGYSDRTPVNGLVYENNYGKTSMDCAFDSHGARNVIIRNNTILDTVNAITAYNDNLRETRPTGWTMDNVLIENNYVDSTRTIPTGTEYPHPCLFIGASNYNTKTESPDNYATFDDFKNCIVRNNYFRTANDYQYGALYFDSSNRNLVFENNTIELYEGAVARIRFNRSIGFVFRNNFSKGIQPTVVFRQAYGEMSGNIGFSYDYALTHVCYIKGLSNYFIGELMPPTIQSGDIYYQNGVKICTNYGVRERITYDTAIKTFSITVTDGVAEVASNVYIPKLALSLTGAATVNAYIKDVIDLEHFSIIDGNGDPIADGTYTATIRDALTASISST